MKKNIQDSTWRACMVGAYGDFISSYIEGIEERFVFLDIGANQGLFSLCAMQNHNCEYVVAIEPNPMTFAKLAENMKFADRMSDFQLICGALSSSTKKVIPMLAPHKHSGAASTAADGPGHAYRFFAPIADPYILHEVIPRREDTSVHVKIDVEGAELDVLQELKRIGLLDRASSMIVEVSDKVRDGSGVEIFEFFRGNRWEMVARSGEGNHFDAIFKPIP